MRHFASSPPLPASHDAAPALSRRAALGRALALGASGLGAAGLGKS